MFESRHIQLKIHKKIGRKMAYFGNKKKQIDLGEKWDVWFPCTFSQPPKMKKMRFLTPFDGP